MAGVTQFEDLVAWQQARALAAAIYRVSNGDRFSRDFALRNQIRGAAISVPSNIAEGFERYRPREFHQFLSIAKASCAELRSDLYLAFDAGYIDNQQLAILLKQAKEVARVTGNLRASVERRLAKTQFSTQHPAPSTSSQ